MTKRATPPDKTCVVCGRSIQWRKKWERDWDEVKYCSKGCRSGGLSDIDRQLERAIVEMLLVRSRDSSICPSEPARAIGADRGLGEEWRTLMEPTRAAARRLVANGEVQITQKGKVVDPSTAKGAIRIRKCR